MPISGENEFKIMFGNLTPSCQKHLLEFYNIRSPDEMNWDIFPIFVLENEDEE